LRRTNGRWRSILAMEMCITILPRSFTGREGLTRRSGGIGKRWIVTRTMKRSTRTWRTLTERKATSTPPPGLYATAVEIDDRNGALWANYGQTLYRGGDLQGAETALRRSLDLLPQQGEPYNNLGNIYVDRGDFDQALSFYRQAVDLGVEELGDVLSNIGDLHRQRGALEEAKSTYERAIDVDPANAAYYQRLGVVERSLGNSLAAEALFREAIDRRSGYWKAHTELAEVLALGGQSEEAIEHFRLATAGDPSYDRAWYGLARGLDEIDRLEEAIVAYETFLGIWPHRDRRYEDVADRLRVLRRGG
jgi:tetratricopeptide (TPR) repeat protein